METCSSSDVRKDTLEAKPACCKISASGSQARLCGIASHLLEATETPAVPPEPQIPGKRKKTPFTFFGVRKSICTLPNFFSGRNKGPGKGAQKSLYKSKTHDCISDVGYGEVKRGPLENISNGGLVFNHHEHRGAKTLPSSQSAHSAIEAGAKLDFHHQRASSCGSTEGLDTKHKEDQSLSFPKAKKGLKGLFSGMRRHKKSKARSCDKEESQELHVLPSCTDQLHDNPRTEAADLQDVHSLNATDKVDTEVSIESPSKKKASSKIQEHPEMDVAATLSESHVVATNCSIAELAELPENDSPIINLDAMLVSPESEEGIIPECGNPDDLTMDPVSSHSADRNSLIFEDVASLKSFDSLTGCGDIIADQDIDSIAESTVSVERSREVTKRSSCLVTYQGGGEEMATPDELGDEYLHRLWESAAECGVTADVKSEEGHVGLQDVSDLCSPLQTGITRLSSEGAVVEPVDLLTPQSDQQGSAPNSDEGYYDSNTPGPEDETADSLSHDYKKDRLSRDSYSGDALYEFYEADDSLMSPPAGEKSLFEREADCPELFDHFLDGGLPSDLNLMHILAQHMGAMETEEDRLAAIQKQILQWELKREAVFKKTEHAHLEKCTNVEPNVECKSRAAVFIGRNQNCLNSEQILTPNSSRTSVNDALSDSGTEPPNWRDFHGMPLPCSDSFYSDQSAMGKCHLQITKKSSDFDSDVYGSVGGISGHKASGMFSNIREVYNGICLSREPSDGVFDLISKDSNSDCEQAVSFSQALVDFTSNGTLFSSLSESIGSSDSGSSFTQNLTSLPTMVNFDIVDVENDGEGEFDQQIEMSAEEEINASFEDFESSYVQKESFAECDEQMFHMDPQIALQSCNWGVASLPRHLSLYRLGSSLPAPLSLNRRSRSLDTESLEFELANLHLSKSGLRSCELPAKWEGKKDDLFYELTNSKERAPPFYADGRADVDWLRSQHYNADLSLEVEEGWDLGRKVDAAVLGSSLHTSALCETDTERQDRKLFERRPPNRGASNPSPRQMVRPSNLPLPSNGRQSPEHSGSYQYYAKHIKNKAAPALPLEEQNRDFTPRFCFTQSSDNPTKSRPIGVTQGVPQFIPNCPETLKHSANYAERYESPPNIMQKGRSEQVEPMPTSWTNDYGDCRSNHMLAFTYSSTGGV
ncbi:APC membrane recruitment protein 1 [Ambystoma mexicanum]|uniref:APC membrane recruitment protein 1 n=1 Tax=Ambystoma mexicanum TaxID=8296 RepID=UPI0037E80B31